ncbi:hypothetical protein Dimus_012820 [Dionaea muscipula]
MYHGRGLSAIKANDGAFHDHEGKRRADSITPGICVDFACWKVYGEESCVLEAASVWSPSRHCGHVHINMNMGFWGKQKFPQEKKDDQKTVGAALIKLVESVSDLKAYLGVRFSLKDGMKPHELVF